MYTSCDIVLQPFDGFILADRVHNSSGYFFGFGTDFLEIAHSFPFFRDFYVLFAVYISSDRSGTCSKITGKGMEPMVCRPCGQLLPGWSVANRYSK